MIINLAWLILLCCGLISSSPNIVKAIQCKSSCYNVIEMIKLKDGRYLTCKARGIKHPPRPSENDSTAVSPQNENLTWYVTKGTEKRIALNITWSLRESYIPKQGNLRNFRGFYLTVGWTNLALRYIARVKINKKKLKHDILIEQNKNSTDIFFSYECYGTKYQFIRPNDNLQVTYSSIPLAKWEDNRQTKIKIIKIPDPNQHNPKNKYKQEQTSNHTKMNSTEISHNLTISTSYFQISKDDYIIWYRKILPPLIAVFLIFLMMTIMLKIVECYKKAKQGQRKKPLHILMIADINNQRNIETIYNMVENLRQDYNLNITSNWEQREEISKDAILWYTGQCNISDVIIFSGLYENFNFDKFIQSDTPNGEDYFSDEFIIARNFILKNYRHMTKDCFILVKKHAHEKSVSKFGRRIQTIAYPGAYSKNARICQKLIKMPKKCREC